MARWLIFGPFCVPAAKPGHFTLQAQADFRSHLINDGAMGIFNKRFACTGGKLPLFRFQTNILFILGANFNVFIYIGGCAILPFSENNVNNTCFIEFVRFSPKVCPQFT